MGLTSLTYLDKCHAVYCSLDIKATVAQHDIAALVIDIFLAPPEGATDPSPCGRWQRGV